MHKPFLAKPPKTKEERAAAAAKYGMIEEDYVPYGEDEEYHGHSYGDYPKITPVCYDAKSGHYNYDCASIKKDFGEVVHPDFYIHQGTFQDTRPKLITPFGHVLRFCGIMFVVYLICFEFSPSHEYPMLENPLPADGRICHTFEKADD